MKDAAVTVPLSTGSVTPPLGVRTPAGVNTTVPPVVDCTDKIPKFMSTSLVMAMGVTMVAVAVALAVSWALVLIPRLMSPNVSV